MLEYKGKKYARVSEILSPFTDFSGIAEEVLNRKAALGSRIHEAINQEIEGYMPIVDLNELGYFKSFNKWRKAIQPTFLETEKRYYCDKKMISGCLDALITIEGEKEAVLVDFKTSAQESPIVWPMQAHLYHYLLTEAGKILAPRFLFIKLDRYGDLPRVFQYKFDPNLRVKCLQAVDDFWRKLPKM